MLRLPGGERISQPESRVAARPPWPSSISRCADADQFAAILALVHEAFGNLAPPSGALNETLDDVAARFKAGPVLIAQADGELVGSLYCALKDGGLYLTRMAVKPSRQKQAIGRALDLPGDEGAVVRGF